MDVIFSYKSLVTIKYETTSLIIAGKQYEEFLLDNADYYLKKSQDYRPCYISGIVWYVKVKAILKNNQYSLVKFYQLYMFSWMGRTLNEFTIGANASKNVYYLLWTSYFHISDW